MLAPLAALRAQSNYATPYTFTTFAGTAGISGSVDGTGSAARFYGPRGVAVDYMGNLYIADSDNHTIRKITSGGLVTPLAGSTGSTGSTNGTGSAARFYFPCGVTVDSAGTIYVGDTINCLLRKITNDGIVTTLAGGLPPFGGDFSGINGTGAAVRFNTTRGVATDSGGNIYLAEEGAHTIRRITSGGTTVTLAGLDREPGLVDGTGSAARFNNLCDVAVDGAGNIYVADTANHTIRKITSGGVVTTLAGLGGGYSGSADGTGSAARFNYPSSVAVDSAGNLYVADSGNHTIRKITSAGVVTTLGGTPGVAGSADGTGSAAQFNWPMGVKVDSAGNLYVADSGNHTIRRGVVFSPPVPVLPALASATAASGMVGQNFTYVVTFSGVSSGFSAVGLPDGLSLDGNTGLISGIPTTAGIYAVTLSATNGAGTGMGTLTLTIMTQIGVTLTFHRLPNTSFATNGSAGDSGAIVPVADATKLSTLTADTIVAGYRADGVTPLVGKIHFTLPLALTTAFEINRSDTALGSVYLLDAGSWQQKSTITAPAGTSDLYVYFGAINADDVLALTGPASVESVGNVSITRQGESVALTSQPYKIRAPIIALIHGYNANGDTWLPPFRQALLDNGRNYKVIEYGVANEQNTTGSLQSLAALLSRELVAAVETDATLRSQFAFTKYDVIAHSQGGVLARMLASENPPLHTEVPKFRSGPNFHRGRFHRVVTIGSPHNGSTLAYFASQRATTGSLPATGLALASLLQPKFDPFGPQIKELNRAGSPWLPDVSARFGMISAAVDPTSLPQFVGLVPGGALGGIVLPNGSDGVVDRDSQEARMWDGVSVNAILPITSETISHSGNPLKQLTGAAGNETGSSLVATKALDMLRTASSTRPFTPPPVLTDLLKTKIDAVVQLYKNGGSLVSLIPQLGAAQKMKVDTTTVQIAEAEGDLLKTVILNPPTDRPVTGAIQWRFQTASSDGTVGMLPLVTNPSSPYEATATVPGGFSGDVVVFASYESGPNIIVSDPIRIFSDPAISLLTELVISPKQFLGGVGETVFPELWGRFPDGSIRPLGLVPGDVTISSNNPAIVSAGPDVQARVLTTDFATVTFTLAGKSVQMLVNPVPPQIVTQPLNQTVLYGTGSTFSIVATGAPAPTYQWQRNGVNIGGATGSSYTIASVGAGDTGSYTVVATNPAGAATSNAAVLAIIAAPSNAVISITVD